jgi:PhnB protein
MTFRCWSEIGHTFAPDAESERADKHMDLLKRAFDAAERIRLTSQHGAIAHCELQIGGSRINIGQVCEGRPTQQLLGQLFVRDCDAVFARALAVGATELVPMTQGFLRTREGRVIDPFGNTWIITSLNDETSPSEAKGNLAFSPYTSPPMGVRSF